MRVLATASVEELRAGLEPIAAGYATWLEQQKANAATLPAHLQPDADEAIIEASQAATRLNQGIAYLLEHEDALKCFRFMNGVMADQRVHTEVAALRSKDDSLEQWGRLKLLKVSVSSGEDGSDTVLKARILDRGVNVGVDEPVEREVSGMGNGPLAAFLNALSNFGIEASVMDYVEHTMSVGTDAMAASYVECQIGEEEDPRIVWGVGIDTSIVTSSLKAIISAINRSER